MIPAALVPGAVQVTASSLPDCATVGVPGALAAPDLIEPEVAEGVPFPMALTANTVKVTDVPAVIELVVQFAVVPEAAQVPVEGVTV